MRFLIVRGSLVLLGSLVSAAAAAGSAAIDGDDMRRHVNFLAADELAGRETGEAQIAIAERYIATAFESYGLEPLPENGFIVPFSLYRQSYDREATGVWFGDLRCRAGQDCRPFPFSESGQFEAPVVFAGYGIHAPDQGWDDYAGLDVRDKIVLVLRHGPGEGQPEDALEGDHQQFSVKATTAQDHGAAGMLLVTDPLNHQGGSDFRLPGRLGFEPPVEERTSDEQEEGILALHISSGFAESLIEDSGRSLVELQQQLNEGTPASKLSIGAPVTRIVVAETREPETVTARNVVALLPGSDPALRDEWVLVGAHHDHVGAYQGSGDTTFNGADDNASGVAAVLEIAQAFASSDPAPKRTMVFATFTAEEKGLLGSRALVRDTLPIDKLVFMLNLDMIGRNSDDELRVFGDGFVRDLRGLIEEANGEEGLGLAFAGESYAANSDHDPFYDQGVPFMFFFSGTHEDYHQVGDHASKLDYARMQQIASLAFRVLDRWSELEVPLAFIHRIPWLGIGVEKRWHHDHSFAEITSVEEGSRGALAGLLEGDRLKRIAGQEIHLPARVGRQFEDIAAGDTAELAWTREGKTHTAEVQRVRPGHMGVMPSGVDAETREQFGLAGGEGLTLRRVVPDGPSAEAGLVNGDIVLRMAGRPVDDTSLRLRLAQLGAGAEVPLVVLRDGERIELTLTIGERPQR